LAIVVIVTKGLRRGDHLGAIDTAEVAQAETLMDGRVAESFHLDGVGIIAGIDTVGVVDTIWFWTWWSRVADQVVVVVGITLITTLVISIVVGLVGVGSELTVVGSGSTFVGLIRPVADQVVVVVGITLIALGITVVVGLVGVGSELTVVGTGIAAGSRRGDVHASAVPIRRSRDADNLRGDSVSAAIGYEGSGICT
jgi:hypothetical protein